MFGRTSYNFFVRKLRCNQTHLLFLISSSVYVFINGNSCGSSTWDLRRWGRTHWQVPWIFFLCPLTQTGDNRNYKYRNTMGIVIINFQSSRKGQPSNTENLPQVPLYINKTTGKKIAVLPQLAKAERKNWTTTLARLKWGMLICPPVYVREAQLKNQDFHFFFLY